MSANPSNSNYQPPADLPFAILVVPVLLGIAVLATVVVVIIKF